MGLKRPDRSREEIAGLPEIHTTECDAFLRASGDSLAPETMVYVIREAQRARKTILIEICGRYLTGAGQPIRPDAGTTVTERVIWAVARRFRFPDNPTVLQDFWSECLDGMWDAILLGRDRKPFWEANFGQALYAKCLDLGRPRYRRSVKEVSLENLQPPAGADVLADIMAHLGEAEILRAIRRLPRQEAQAAFLHWVEKRPVDSAAAGSVRNVMGLSARHIHNLLSNAQERLAQDPIIRTLREDS